MEKKTTEAYFDVFNFLKQKEISFKSIMIDFEKGIKRAIAQVYPTCAIFGCHFHFSQVIISNYTLWTLKKFFSIFFYI